MFASCRLSAQRVLPLLVAAMVAPVAAQTLSMPSDPLGSAAVAGPTSSVSGPGASTVTPLGAPGMTGQGDYSGLATQSGAAPAAAYSSGAVFNPTLGSHIRARYSTESYAQEEGNLDLGTMKLWNAYDGMMFLDGQVTMNDESRVGYNVGLGYRWMTLPLLPNSPDNAKIAGLSVWTDGQGVDGDNFFPQVGVSFEYLGDRLDFRSNVYIPVGDDTQTRDFIRTGDTAFTGFNVGQGAVGVLDTALTAADAELAGRIQDLDAWVFGGVYGFNGDGDVDGFGGKLGLRGYATPDLALSIALTNDDVFDTNAVFSATWFIGRTRRENCPCGRLEDRFREPVLRNDYVATHQSRVTRVEDVAVDADGDAVRIVHVDSTASAGGDGSFERPLNNLNDINGNSQDGDVVLAHATSTFTGQGAVLRDDQRFIGEGAGRQFTVATSNGTLTLPETATGARDLAIPVITNTTQVGVMLADDNIVENLSFSGGVNAIRSDAAVGSHNSTLRNLTIAATTGDAIILDAFDGADEDDLDDDNNLTETTNRLGTVAISNVTFDDVDGRDILINGATTAAVQRSESITITNVTSNDNIGPESIAILDTLGTTGANITISNYDFNGSAGSGGALRFEGNDGPISVAQSTIDGGAGPGIRVLNTSGTVSVANDVTINNVNGAAVDVSGNTGAVAVSAAITGSGSATEAAVQVASNTAAVSFTGAIQSNDNADTVEITSAAADVNFSGAITSVGTGDTITITNAGIATPDVKADVTFSGAVSNDTGGRVVVVDGGDDRITFNSTVTQLATGDGISITNRGAGTTTDPSEVRFAGNTTLTTGASDAVTLGANDAASSVTFTNLNATTTTGNIIAGNTPTQTAIGGVNVTAGTATTSTGRVVSLQGGSSSTGVNFTDVTVNGADNAVNAADFNGRIALGSGTTAGDGGTISTTGAAVLATNTSVTLDAVTVTSTSGRAVDATYNNANNHTVTVTDSDLNEGDVVVNATAASTGNTTVTATNLTDAGDFDLDNTGSGDLITTMTNVASTGTAKNVALDITSSGDGLLTMSSVNLGGSVIGRSSAASSGALGVTILNSGGTTAFTTLQLDDDGSGAASMTLNNVRGTSGVDFDSAAGGDASLSVSGGAYTGAIDAAATNTGNFSASVTNNPTLTTGSVSFNAGNTGDVTYRLTNLVFNTGAGTTAMNLVLGANVDNANVTVTNNTGVVTANATAFNFDVNGGDVNFQLAGNTFTNNSTTIQTALIDVSGGSTVLDATITNNTFTNTNVAGPVQFELDTSGGNPTANLNISGNIANSGAGPGNGTFFIDENAGQINLFERSLTFNNTTRNAGTVTFDPAVEASYGDLVSPPQLPQ